MKQDHLVRAKHYIAKGEDYYRKAAALIVLAKKADPGLTNGAIGTQLGRNESWVRKLIAWVENSAPAPSPFGGEAENVRKDISAARKVARENPEAIAEAIAEAPPEAQRKIADRIVSSTTDESLKAAIRPPSHKAQTPDSAEKKLGDAVFALWDVGEVLMDEVPDGESKIRMLALAEKSVRLGHMLVAILEGGDLQDELAQLLEEVKAE